MVTPAFDVSGRLRGCRAVAEERFDGFLFADAGVFGCVFRVHFRHDVTRDVSKGLACGKFAGEVNPDGIEACHERFSECGQRRGSLFDSLCR
jgi:hypothetical protein